jgi:elongation factor G
VEPQSETVWRQADRFHVPVCFVNKMDRWEPLSITPSNPSKSDWSANVIATNANRYEAEFKGVIDLLEQKAIYWEMQGTTLIYDEIRKN